MAPRHARHRADRRRGHGEKGSTSIELVIVMPALFGLMFVGVQAALVHHARQVAVAAANEGAMVAGGEGGTAALGIAHASGFLDQVGDDALTGWQVTGERDGTTTVVRVTGTSMSVIPGWSPRVSAVGSVASEELSTIVGEP